MNIDTINFNSVRVTRYRDDSVTIAYLGSAQNYPGGWMTFSVAREAIKARAFGGDDFRNKMEAHLLALFTVGA